MGDSLPIPKLSRSTTSRFSSLAAGLAFFPKLVELQFRIKKEQFQ